MTATTYVVGLTGGIGSGKTVASDHFAELGVPVIDTDVIARQIVDPGQAALKELTAAFGEKILLSDGHLDRAELRTIAFSSQENKATLDNITHPAIRQETFRQISEVTYPYCVVVVPLLSDNSPFSALMQRILVVTAKRDTKITRVQKRSGLTRDEIERIMATQLSDNKRNEFADDVIANDGTIEDAQRAVKQLHQKYLELAQ